MLDYYEQLTSNQKELVKLHLQLVEEANKKLNLTRIENLEEAMLLHVEDSLSALPEVEGAPAGLYADLGSGAGFPGVPIAIATGRKTLLVDSRQKKMTAVQVILENMDLQEQVEVFSGRAELLARKRPGQFSVITARALSKLNVLLELASPLLSKGGILVCYKSTVEDEEYKDALRVQKIVGMELKSDRSFMLAGEYTRRIISFEKVGKPKIKLPRLEGQAQKKPL